MPALTTEAIRLVTCPRCHQGATFDCRAPSGRKVDCHWERTAELNRLHPEVHKSCRIKLVSLPNLKLK